MSKLALAGCNLGMASGMCEAHAVGVVIAYVGQVGGGISRRWGAGLSGRPGVGEAVAEIGGEPSRA